MFKNSYQSGLLSIFYSCGANPLALWEMEVKNGHIKRLTDNEVNSIVLEIVSTNVATTYITCPKNSQYLGIKLPFLVMIVKNLKRYFSFEITILDDKNMRRRFRISNFQSTTKIKPFCTSMPIGLSGGWNQIQFNLSDFTRRAYGTQFIETLRVQVHANVRLRRIYFAERLYTEEELPQEYKLYLPLEKKQKKSKKVQEDAAAGYKDIAAVPEGEKPVAAEPAPPAGRKSTVVVTPVSESAEEKPLEEIIEAPVEALARPPEDEPVEGAAEAPAETPAESTTEGVPENTEDGEPPEEVPTEVPPEEAAEVPEEALGEMPAEGATEEAPAEEAPAE